MHLKSRDRVVNLAKLRCFVKFLIFPRSPILSIMSAICMKFRKLKQKSFFFYAWNLVSGSKHSIRSSTLPMIYKIILVWVERSQVHNPSRYCWIFPCRFYKSWIRYVGTCSSVARILISHEPSKSEMLRDTYRFMQVHGCSKCILPDSSEFHLIIIALNLSWILSVLLFPILHPSTVAVLTDLSFLKPNSMCRSNSQSCRDIQLTMWLYKRL